MRIIQLSDIHVWRYTWNIRHLAGRRMMTVLDLMRGRAARFRLERLEEVVARVLALEPDHILITGDFTTTALPSEFRDVRREMAPILADPSRVTVVPGNHDRTSRASLRLRRFEEFFADCLPSTNYPWLRSLDEDTAVLGLDATRATISAKGRLPETQMAAADRLLADRPSRLIVACHYPVFAPPLYQAELRHKRLINDEAVCSWLGTIGPHLYCCGHVHAAWAFTPPRLLNQLCLNSGAPLMRDPTGVRLPGFLEIVLEGSDVVVTHHAWDGTTWVTVPMVESPGFLGRTASIAEVTGQPVMADPRPEMALQAEGTEPPA